MELEANSLKEQLLSSSDSPAAVKQPLTNTKNLWLIGLYIFSSSFTESGVYSIGVLWYFGSWNMPLIWIGNASVLAFTFRTFTR